MSTYCDGDLIEMAKKIKRIFTKYKRQFEPRFKVSAQRNKRVWEKAAVICLEESLDPERYVAAQFHELYNPYPGVLSNRPKAVARYGRYVRDRTESGRADLYITLQMDLIMSRAANKHVDMERFLSDPHEEICPLMRYTASIVLGLHDLAVTLKDAAHAYADTHPDVAEVVRDRFPGVKECQP